MAKVLNLLPKKAKDKVKSKREARRIHFQARFRQRMGYILTDVKYQEMLDAPKTFLYKSKDLASVYGMKFQGMPIKVVYDAFSHELITILEINHPYVKAK